MIRALLNFGISLVLAAIALLIVAGTVSGVTLNASGYVVAALVFAVAQTVLSPFVFNMARKYASAVLGGIGIVSCMLALWIATLFPGGLTIDGIGAWIQSALIVWLVTALGGWFLGWLVIKKWWTKRQEDKRIESLAARKAASAG
ncbi:phage holin family protein [Micropruina sp.]|uniref:phage holin family protein n=1 Tax=Micropruina sp. TaxID=2737536 RepID=UPI0039E72434